MEGEFRTNFVRDPQALRHNPALVLNADYRPLSYYPLSLWPWQEAVKAAWLDADAMTEAEKATFHTEKLLVVNPGYRNFSGDSSCAGSSNSATNPTDCPDLATNDWEGLRPAVVPTVPSAGR